MLELKAVRKTLGGRTLFSDLTLEVPSGSFVAIRGESGTGKSTLLNLVAGLEQPDSGEIRLDDVELTRLDDDARTHWRRDKLGFVFQAFHVLPHLTILDNAALPLRLQGCAPAKARVAAQGMLGAVGLGTRGAGWPGELSGGELQRLAIARALVHRPALVLADEPTGNLDPDNAARILTLLAEQVRARGATCLMVTHSEHAAAIADRVLVLANGALIELP